MKIEVLWDDVVASKYRHFGGMYCLFLHLLAVWVSKHHWRLECSVNVERALYKVFMEFILLMNRIKCWYNYPWQILTVAPALHSLIIRECYGAPRILEFLFRIHHVRKLILERCCLGEDSTGILAKIVTLYPDLEVLSLESCYPLSSAVYYLIPYLKKLSGLNLQDCEVDYVYVKPV